MLDNKKRKSREELHHLVILAYLIGFVILLIELYYTNYALVVGLNLNVGFIDSALDTLQLSVLDKALQSRGMIFLISLMILIYPSHYETKNSLMKDILNTLPFIVIFFLITFLTYLPSPNYVGQGVNIIGSCVAYFFICRRLFIVSTHINSAASLKENKILADGFAQTQAEINSNVSINFDYIFSYKNKLNKGKINIINPFRASYVIGTPGSGKSYAILEEYIRQLIQKDFSAVIYDYKDPTLSQLTYNYFLNQHKNDKYSFEYISFKHINKTKRCNPIKNIATAAEALDIANVMLVALNKQFASKQGEFFVESAAKFTALNIYALGILSQGEYQTLPHVISLLSQKASLSFPALKVLSIFYPDMRNLFAPFQEAYDNNVLPQLQGQLASAQIGLGSMSDSSLAYVMTEDDDDNFNINLEDVNSFENPQILCIGNDAQKDKIFGLANSVFLSRLSKVINKKGTPCLFAVDELPTVYINGLDNLIATARSNKIAVLLGFQDYSQLFRDYGDKIAKAIINTIGNLFIGAVKGETAKSAAESFGEKKVQKNSKSINEEGSVTVSTAEHKEKKIPIDIIEELTQGEFVGRIADEADAPIENKVFHGKITIDPKVKDTKKEIPNLRNWSEDEITKKLQINLINIDIKISEILTELNEIAAQRDLLIGITAISKENKGVALERFLQEPIKDNLFFLVVWLEEAYYIIHKIEELNLKNDVLDFEMKFELLLRDIYKKDLEGISQVLSAIQEYELFTIEKVQELVVELEQDFGNVNENYDPI